MISSIILAAGTSSRMGEPKALLDWDGEPLVAWQVRQLREAGVDEVIVVIGHRADEVHRKIGKSDCRVMVNPRYYHGRAGSLRIGAKAVSRDADAIVVMGVDQPRPAEFLRKLVAAHGDASAATRPVFDGHKGHPVVVSGRLRAEMMAATDEQEGLKGVLRQHLAEIGETPMDDVCLVDVNTPEELATARHRFGLGH